MSEHQAKERELAQRFDAVRMHRDQLLQTMSPRDHFACAALPFTTVPMEILAQGEDAAARYIARTAYIIADAMMDERARES